MPFTGNVSSTPLHQCNGVQVTTSPGHRCHGNDPRPPKTVLPLGSEAMFSSPAAPKWLSASQWDSQQMYWWSKPCYHFHWILSSHDNPIWETWRHQKPSWSVFPYLYLLKKTRIWGWEIQHWKPQMSSWHLLQKYVKLLNNGLYHRMPIFH